MSEEVKPPFTRYYLRQRHGVGESDAQECIDAYKGTHEALGQLDCVIVQNPTMLSRVPNRTSDHYTMFISIMEKDQETFEKELFKLSLEFGTIEIAKKETIQYLRQPGVKDW